MFNKCLPFFLLVIISACGTNQSPPYQQEISAETLDQHSDAEALKQQKKDQAHLINKELADKCSAAKIDLAMAEQEENAKEIHQQIGLINSNCVEEE